MSFPCTKCGACCRLIGAAVKALQANPEAAVSVADRMVLNFPYGITEDGVCEKYDPSIGCTVYEQRPDLCRVDKMYQLCNTRTPMNWMEYLQVHAALCNIMIDVLEIDPGKKVKIPYIWS